MNLEQFLKDRRDRINKTLDKFLPPSNQEPVKLHEAMRYSVIDGGKRMRPLLIYATGEIFNAPLEILDIPACAIELIHAFSLIHDDLPAMDDDDIRRGKPSCHKAFGEATAILAGDALPFFAFEILCTNLEPKMFQEMSCVITKACGSLGIAGGQELDIKFLKQKITLEQLEYMYSLKTGALFKACIQLGAIAGGITDKNILNILNEYVSYIGLAFQIQDDLLDIDETDEKITYPSLVGLDKSKTKVNELYEKAMETIKKIEADTTILVDLTNYIMKRKY